MADRPTGALRHRQTQDRFIPPSRGINRYRDGGLEVLPARKPRDTTVSFTVMAHPKRAQWAEELADRLGATITWDRFNDRHETGLRAILSSAGGTHHCVVQDDAVVPDGFVETVSEACRWVEPDAPASFYYGGLRTSHQSSWDFARKNGASWLVRKGPIWGPAIVYPVSTLPALERFYTVSDVQNYDRRVMRFYQSIERLCWYSVPSLVDHRQEDNPSLCGHDRPGRRAVEFVGPQNALEVDWSGPVVRSRR